MLKGVSESEWQILLNILRQFPGCVFYAFGSRVKGNFSGLSDLDLLVKNANKDMIADLKYRFDNSYLPYVVNLVDFNTIEDKFYELIKDDLVQIG